MTPLEAGKGQIEIVHSFRSAANYLKVAFLRRGGVRTMTKKKGEWHRGPLHTSPPIPPGRTVRLTLRGRDVFFDEMLLLRLRTMPTGRCGIGVHDGAADFVIR